MIRLRNRTKDVSVIDDVASEPLTLQEVKDFLKVSFDDEDVLIEKMITSAREIIETALNISIAQKTIMVTFTHDGCNWYALPYGPIGAIQEVTNLFCEGSTVSFSTDSYKTIGADFKQFKSSSGYYTIKYAAGYETVPQAILEGMKKQIAWMYENRGDSAGNGQINPDVMNLLAPFSKNTFI